VQDIAVKVSDLLDRLAVLPQYLLPKRMLTAFAGRCAASRAQWWTRRVIPWFIARYGVNSADAADPGAAGYACFNDFFTRALREGARPLARADFVCPVDGTVIQCGTIEARSCRRPRMSCVA
jgi:phosphatidylserine decarboxylase